ncbi:MAG: NifU family protein, partial [Candidatus Omnitrophica bacterium]|nr:NifU family protein [Candidatus Omnitrophota bacterium]
EPKKKAAPAPTDPELIKIDAIINKNVRPYLQMDGGDLQLIALNGNVLIINYQGACGSCPSSTMGTLKAIENLLRDEYNPEITVELAV